MGQMAAHLSHEIRNPIGSIALLTSTLMKKVIPKNKSIVFEIQKSIYRIERIIKATLMFSKGVKTQIESISWMSIYDELHSAISYYSYSKDIDFIFPENDFDLQGDKDLLVMLFSNFIFNAIDAIELDDEESGVIELLHVRQDNHHHFKIYDTGIAIENKNMLFEAFKSTKEKGNGLGLILSKQIAEAHGGEVGLCEGKRKGFYILLKD
jgi:two-component system NtrC family sensor kinase/two-component system sensor histidine kinase AtoS